jgi:hypothetical protein
LRFRAIDDGPGGNRVCMIRHGRNSCLERLPAFKPMSPGDQFLRIAELEALQQDFGIGHLAKARQARPDLGRDRIIPFAMPAQDELGLLSEVFETGHGRATVDIAEAVNA